MVDEIDVLVSMDRLRTMHALAKVGNPQSEVVTHCIDPLTVLALSKCVIGFCAYVDETVSRITKDTSCSVKPQS